MTQQTPEWWERARRVRDQLVVQFGAHPAVTMVDIGLLSPPTVIPAAPPSPLGQVQPRLGVRVHVRGDPRGLRVPAEIDGIAIQVIAGEYRPQREPG